MADDPRFVVTEVVIEGKTVKTVAPRVPALPAWTETSRVGRDSPRLDALDKVTGRARYTTDIAIPGMLHAAFVRAPHARAEILEIDPAPASAVPGVILVMTGNDTKDRAFEDFPLLARSDVRYYGQEVAAILALTPEAARAGAKALRPRYRPLDPVLDPEKSLAPDAPDPGPGQRFTGGGWGGQPRPDEPARYVRGDVASGFAGSAQVIERTYRTPMVVHASLEPHATVVQWKGEDLTVWESTQGVFDVRETLAEAIGHPLNRIRVIGTHMGGGFGAKTRSGQHTVLAALMARQVGRPVRFVLSREDELLAPYYRPGSIQQVKLGASVDGHLLALSLRAVNPIGAYRYQSVWGSCEAIYQELYAIPNLLTEGYAVHTHIPPPVPMRGPGHVQGAWALEQAIDELAGALELDPVDLRLLNIPDLDPRTQKPYASHGLRACLERGRKAFNWKASRTRKNGAGPALRGVGVACSVWGGGGGPPATAMVRIHEDGSVDLLTGAADLGTGTRTVLAQIVAEELALEPEQIQVVNADTATTPYTLPSYGSITLASSGPAVRQAAAAAREQLVALAGLLMDVPQGELVLQGGEITEAAGGGSRMRIGEVAARMPSRMILGKGERGPNPDLTLATFGAQFVEVELDSGTGRVRVVRATAVHDSGRVINPRLWRSQILGGLTMGLGYALMEEKVLDPEGAVVTGGFGDYRIPTIADVPDELEILDAGVPFPANEIGAKGIGEPPLIPTAPAIGNALFHACGVRVGRLPLDPGTVLDHLAGAAGDRARAGGDRGRPGDREPGSGPGPGSRPGPGPGPGPGSGPGPDEGGTRGP